MTKLYKCDKCGAVLNYCKNVYFTWDNQKMDVDLCEQCNTEIRTILKKLLKKDFEDLIGLGLPCIP